ncbi:hypothetical protein JTB14_001332 [Gonioctena quinquepunctata]|nr:hypothetical protein JTB14_001332 [Gonioctena quinquepunctata]
MNGIGKTSVDERLNRGIPKSESAPATSTAHRILDLEAETPETTIESEVDHTGKIKNTSKLTQQKKTTNAPKATEGNQPQPKCKPRHKRKDCDPPADKTEGVLAFYKTDMDKLGDDHLVEDEVQAAHSSATQDGRVFQPKRAGVPPFEKRAVRGR